MIYGPTWQLRSDYILTSAPRPNLLLRPRIFVLYPSPIMHIFCHSALAPVTDSCASTYHHPSSILSHERQDPYSHAERLSLFASAAILVRCSSFLPWTPSHRICNIRCGLDKANSATAARLLDSRLHETGVPSREHDREREPEEKTRTNAPGDKVMS